MRVRDVVVGLGVVAVVWGLWGFLVSAWVFPHFGLVWALAVMTIPGMVLAFVIANGDE